jgi:leader peptidase (prepilin peptidase)/N-methyltransferase
MPFALYVVGAVFAFLFGIVVGSFLNVCIYRLPRGESLLAPPSHCPQCNTRLRPLDLVPLLSFLALNARCRYCKAPISWRYFIIEAVTGVLFVATWVSLAARAGSVLLSPVGLPLLICLLAWMSTMLVTFMIDLDTTLVIEPVTWIAMGAGLLAEMLLAWGRVETVGSATVPYLPQAVPGMVVGFLVFVAFDLFGSLIFRKPSMGVGDAYIGAAIGALLGPGLALLSFGMAVLLASVVGVVLLARAAMKPKKKSAATEDEGEMPPPYSPVKPFLIGGAVLLALWGILNLVCRGLGTNYGPDNSLLGLIVPLVAGAAVIAALILLAPLWPSQTVEVIPEGEEEPVEELPEGHYLPFGPFLTACAMVVALAPEWIATHAAALWQAYMRIY